MTLKISWLAIGLIGLIALPPLWTARMAAPFFPHFPQIDPSFLPSKQTAPPEPEIETIPSPDGQWTAILNPAAGSLTLADPRHQQSEIFPAGSTVQKISWSPDSRRLLIVRTNWLPLDASSAISATEPLELWRLDLDLQQRTFSTPTLLYQAPQPDPTHLMALPQQAILGSWSPNSRHLLLGLSRLSASLLADGIPFWVLDTDSGQLHPVAHDSRLSDDTSEATLGNIALPNPRYHSWSPDGSRLAITVGGYRSAQLNKWLNLVEVTTGRVTTLISRTEQIPGIVSWSPRSPQGDWLAYAAIPAALSHEDAADWLAFENPAIAGRRIHLLNPTIGQHRRLNHQAAYQDAPVWNSDGSALYYVERDGDQLKLRQLNLHTGEDRAMPDAVQPLDWAESPRANVGYYGQFDREALPMLPN